MLEKQQNIWNNDAIKLAIKIIQSYNSTLFKK